jgi:23S rRNA-/tRNA-specific pseudouridylate synthase
LLLYEKPPFELPVIYEDDYFAIVNKPAGVVVYGTGRGRIFRMSVRAALPFVLAPPARGTHAILRRPASVHRLDKPTSGLLLIAKTKPAMVNLAQQFHDRVVKKTYMAIVNGIPDEPLESKLSSNEAFQLGVDVSEQDDHMEWQIIDSPLDDKHAITIWRSCQYVNSLYANDGCLTLIEVKLKTGRYHQIRRHMAWNCKTPVIGDDIYDGGKPDALKFRGRGLFLCSTRVTLEHPFYNTPPGRVVWDNLSEQSKVFHHGTLWLSNNNRVMVTANIDLPDKFRNVLTKAEIRFNKFSNDQVVRD